MLQDYIAEKNRPKDAGKVELSRHLQLSKEDFNRFMSGNMQIKLGLHGDVHIKLCVRNGDVELVRDDDS